MTTQPTRLEVRANMQLTDEQIVTAGYMHTVETDEPLFTFDRKELIAMVRELLSASKPAAQDEREQAYREATKPRPETSGVGEYCQPGDRREPRWIVMYDDADRSLSIFEDEQDARDCFANSEAMGWNCWLFSPTPRVRAASSQPSPTAVALDDERAAWRDHPAALDTKALATAQEIALMWGQDRSQFVSRIQVAVREAMDWVRAAVAQPVEQTTERPPALTLTAEQIEAIEYGADCIHDVWGETMKVEETLRSLLVVAQPVEQTRALTDHWIDMMAVDACVAGDSKGRLIFTRAAARAFARDVQRALLTAARPASGETE